MLKTAAILNFILALGHLACLPWLKVIFKFYGINRIMNHLAFYGASLPYIITIGIAISFSIASLYALSAEGEIRKLPLLWPIIYFIAFVFLFRAGIGIFGMIEKDQYPFKSSSAVIISGAIGILYLMGGIKKQKKAINKNH